MRIELLPRPGFDVTGEGPLRTATFSWLLRTVIPQGTTMLDLGAGPCVFARRAVAAGYHVTAVDGRTERLPDDLDPKQVEFVQSDVRTFPAGEYDVVVVLGLLYHLELDDQLALLRRHNGSTVILDTQVHIPEAVTAECGDWAQVLVKRRDYVGVCFPEQSNPMAGIGNPTSFWPDEPSLLRMIEDSGYESCRVVDPYYVSKYGARRFYVLANHDAA
jgi:ubiquinone/menaquinone biosynthesis C-methylase UbiE